MMLKATTTTETVVLVDNRELIAICKANGINAIHIDEAVTTGAATGANVICVDDVKAYDMAQRLLDQGMDRKLVRAVDLQTFEGGSRDLLTGGDLSFIRECSRPWHFNELRSMEDAHDDPADRIRFPSGLAFLDPYLQWRQHEVCICTGPYGCGKSLLMNQLAMKWTEGLGGYYADGTPREVAAWLCMWEDEPVEQRDDIMRHYTFGVKDADKYQVEQARGIRRRMYHTHPKFTRTRDLNWYVERVRMLNEDYGTNFFVLDPWSEFDHERYSHENETEYCKRIMKELSALSIELRVIFCVVTHIPKAKYAEDGSIKPFRVADAMGSVQFGSTASRGICVLRAQVMKHHNDMRDYLVIHFDKIKNERNMGKKGTLAVRYNMDRHSLEHCPDASATAHEMWTGVAAKKEGQ